MNSSGPTLSNPIDYTVHGILQVGILEWVAFPLSRGSSQPRDRTQVSHSTSRFFTSWATKEAQWTVRTQNSKNIYIMLWNFPSGPVVKNLPARGHKFDPWSGKIPQATEQLSPGTTAIETLRPRARAPKQKISPQWEACTWQLESSSCSSQLEKAHRQQWKHNTAKNKINKYNF